MPATGRRQGSFECPTRQIINMKLRQKILTVDDEALNREILADYLAIAGFEVIEADDGDTALAMLADHPDADAIVLDRMMPRMDGMKVLGTLKNNPNSAKFRSSSRRRPLPASKSSKASAPAPITI